MKRLYQANTYQPTERLLELRTEKAFLTKEDLFELFEEFADGEEGWGNGTRNVTMVAFGAWLLGNKPSLFAEYEPAEILW